MYQHFIVQNIDIVKLGLVVATLGRVDSLRRLFDSLRGRLTADDRLIVVTQGDRVAVERLAAEFRDDSFPIVIVGSTPGAAIARNTGVAALPPDINYLLNFPNDTTWYPAGTVERLRSLPDDFSIGALTVVDEHGPKFTLPDAGAPLDRWNVWSAIEMGILVRRYAFEAVGGFDPSIGTGAATPWQAGEATDLLLKMRSAGMVDEFAWQPAAVSVGGIADAHGLSRAERRHKLRAYGRGLGRLVAHWHYPLWWRFAFTAGGLAFGIRHCSTNEVADGWWVFLGRLEGALGHTLGRSVQVRAVER